MLGFTLKNAAHAIIDKVSGAPPRPVRVAEYVAVHARSGEPEDVLRTIDKFAREERWLMNVGPDKGPLVEEMAARLPATARVLELGAYCGYSSIMLAHALGPEASVTSIEINGAFVESARANVAVAGLSEQITFLHGPSTEVLASVEGRFDLVFLDHWKDLYKGDLQLMEQRGLVGPGTIVVADNVGEIFSPDEYLEYVRNVGHYTSEHREAQIEYTQHADAVEISVHQ
ncbi:MAG: class I SAM-dependent methyltransferase [Pseudomonadota bacterium]